MKKTNQLLYGFLFVFILLAGCNLAPPDPLLHSNPDDPDYENPLGSDSKEITSFEFSDPLTEGTIDEEEKTITIPVPYGTDVTNLTPNISHTGAEVNPGSGIPQDFTDGVLYTVTAENGSTAVYTARVTLSGMLAAPVCSPPGGVYNEEQTITLSAEDGASIFYTTDGSDPASSPGRLEYTVPITVNISATIRAVASRTGWDDSPGTSETYTLRPETPVISHIGGTYTSAQSVGITCNTDGAVIYYTTDGSDPTAPGTRMEYDGIISVDSALTLRTVSEKNGWSTSPEESAAYIVSTDFTYSEFSGNATITDYTGSDTDIIVPSVLDGYTVTGIGDEAFRWVLMESIVIPDSVTYIGVQAFSSCTNLASVTMSSSITEMKTWAFRSCSSLTSLVLPDSLTSIEGLVFDSCTSLANITFGSALESIGNNAFTGCSSLTNIAIPDTVTTIGMSVFCYCTGLTDVTIGNSVTAIGTSMFSECINLENVTIGSAVTSIGGSAFNACSSLATIIIPDPVTSIGESAFRNCTALTDADIGSGILTIGNYSFNGCTSLTNVTLDTAVPPTVYENSFTDNGTGRKFYVPSGSVTAYRDDIAKGWWYYDDGDIQSQ